MKVTLVRVTQDAKMAMAEAGSNCYDSEARAGIVDHCYKSGHHSIMEFADFHFHIEEVSRALTHQLVRHRLASFAQRSQRYCKEDGFGYVTPQSIKNKRFKIDLSSVGINTANYQMSYDEMIYIIQEFYNAMVQAGIPTEDSRYVLPNSCDTVIDVKINFRALMNFMNERLCTRAQWEIRKLAWLMKEAVEKYDPQLAKFLIPKCEKHAPNCFCYEDKKHSYCGRNPHISDVFEMYSKYRDIDAMCGLMCSEPDPEENSLQ